jgi:uncharacterized protein (TIGR00255 family)
MTGHGAASRNDDRTTVLVEVRTINSRYMKTVVRLSEGYSGLEPLIEEMLRGHIRRGTVQVNVQVHRQSTGEDYEINAEVLNAYLQQVSAIGKSASVDTLLTLPGVVVERTAEQLHVKAVWPLIKDSLRASLERLSEMRVEEGRAMAADLAENRRQIETYLTEVARSAPGIAAAYETRLTDRIKKMLSEHGLELDAASVIREVGIFAERADISEEVVRLRSHLEQFDRFVDTPDSNGRKLDFLVQEMFREANTIGSKANNAEIAKHVVEIKACIERMREMIQNIE